MTAIPERRSLAGQAVQLLRELVLTGEIAPGQRLNEVELAARMRISRGPLREAVRHLTSEGLLVYQAHHGTRVRLADAAELRALFELRAALECAAARLAAQRRTEAELARLREVSTSSRAERPDHRFPYQLDLAFHRAMVDAAASPLVAEQVRLVQQQVILLRSRHIVDPVHTNASLDDHDRLIAAIEARDGDQAARVMAEHLTRVRDQMEEARGGAVGMGRTDLARAHREGPGGPAVAAGELAG
ncbi:MAG TPA: GntR family transcriptional regulator [Pseudonocardiaceae bacterium]|jgi:DNA-binding GntR family transcriptional regulator|nr:GntR family transcriptional regulator [Pseudonocardiaceae bacterium]